MSYIKYILSVCVGGGGIGTKRTIKTGRNDPTENQVENDPVETTHGRYGRKPMFNMLRPLSGHWPIDHVACDIMKVVIAEVIDMSLNAISFLVSNTLDRSLGDLRNFI